MPIPGVAGIVIRPSRTVIFGVYHEGSASSV